MLGAIIGDTVGSVYEFDNIKTTEFPLFSPKSNYTDDSVMSFAVADWLLHTDRSQKALEEKLVSWANNYPCPMGGYGGSFRKWLFHPEMLPPYTGERKPYGSFGNGSPMRCSACGWVAQSLEEALDLAKRSAEITHNHREGIKGAQATAAAIFMGREGKSKEDIRTYIEQTFGYNLHRTCDDIRPTYTFNETCQQTVPEAIIAFLDSTDFESAIRLGVSLGGDSDTLCDITGAIAEAYYSTIPQSIIDNMLELLPSELWNLTQEVKHYHKQATIALTADFQERVERIKALREQLAELTERREHIINFESPTLTSLYLELLGKLQYEWFELDVEVRRLKRLSELVQVKINRGETVVMEQIHEQLNREFELYQKELNRMLEDLRNAKDYLASPLMSDEEVQELKDLYRLLMKRLHPDWNPNLTDKEREAYVRAVAAYHQKNIQELRTILLSFDLEKPLDISTENEAQKQIEQLEKCVADLKSRIEQLLSSFPFTFKDKLQDDEWIKQEQDRLQQAIQQLREEKERWDIYVAAISMQYNTKAEA